MSVGGKAAGDDWVKRRDRNLMRKPEVLEKGFESLGIPYDRPEFYNLEEFRRVERANSHYLESYAEYVQVRPYSEEYIERCHRVVPKVVSYLRGELRKDGREGACADASAALSKILERIGLWNHITAGSLTIVFDAHTGLTPRYWAHLCNKPETVGHAWVTCPPYAVIDLTISQQARIERVREHLPDVVLSEDHEEVEGVALEDMVDMDLLGHIERLRGHVPTIHEVMRQNGSIANVLRTFRPFAVRSHSSTLKYFPCAIRAIIETFEEAKTHCFSGRSLPNLFEDLVRAVGDDILE